VAVLDGGGRTVSSVSGEVSIALGRKPDDEARLSGDRTRNLDSGVATFDDLRVRGEGSGYTLVATLSGVGSIESNPFQIHD
jgi:hypothetical protein